MTAPTFEAQYPGTCNECGDRFEADESIRFGPIGVEHAKCPEDTPPQEVCPRCFTEKALNGSCACD